MDANQTIPEGTLLRLDDGVGQDYHVLGLYRVLKPFVASEQADVIEDTDRYGCYHYVDARDYAAKLISQGYVERVIHYVIFVPHFGDPDPMTCKIEGVDDGC